MSGALDRPTWREKIQFAVAAALILIGAVGLGMTGLVENEAQAESFLMHGSLLACGYLLGWGVGGRWPWVVMVVAIVARIALLPFESSEDTSRRIWEAEVLSSDINPLAVTPNDESVAHLRDENWERIAEKDRVSRQNPGSFLLYRGFNSIGFGVVGIKIAALLVDLLLCLLLATTFGKNRVTLYAWNPLAIYYSAGAGQYLIFSLLPIAGAIALWARWVEKKGGLHLLSARDIGGGVGQIVGVSTFLAGTAAVLDLVWSPFLVWMVWLVTRRAGARAGLTVLLSGLAPFIATRIWAVLALDLAPLDSIGLDFYVDPTGMSLLAQANAIWSDWVVLHYEAIFLGIGIVILFWILTNDTIERFGVLVICLFLLFAPLAQPWHVLMLAPFAGETGRNVFRIATLCSLAYFWSYRDHMVSGEWVLSVWQLMTIWLPIAFCSIWYALTHSSKEDGFYVRSH